MIELNTWLSWRDDSSLYGGGHIEILSGYLSDGKKYELEQVLHELDGEVDGEIFGLDEILTLGYSADSGAYTAETYQPPTCDVSIDEFYEMVLASWEN